MATEEQVRDFRDKMRELMTAYNEIHRKWTNNIYSPAFQKQYATLLKKEEEGERMFQDITGLRSPINFITECDEHMLLESWCREILNEYDNN